MEVPQETLQIHRPLTVEGITVCEKRRAQMYRGPRVGARECLEKKEMKAILHVKIGEISPKLMQISIFFLAAQHVGS